MHSWEVGLDSLICSLVVQKIFAEHIPCATYCTSVNDTQSAPGPSVRSLSRARND